MVTSGSVARSDDGAHGLTANGIRRQLQPTHLANSNMRFRSTILKPGVSPWSCCVMSILPGSVASDASWRIRDPSTIYDARRAMSNMIVRCVRPLARATDGVNNRPRNTSTLTEQIEQRMPLPAHISYLASLSHQTAVHQMFRAAYGQSTPSTQALKNKKSRSENRPRNRVTELLAAGMENRVQAG